MVVGGLCALVHGAASPLMLLVYGMMTDTFVAYELEVQELKDPNKECNNNSIYWINGSIFETAENETVYCGWVSSSLLMRSVWYWEAANHFVSLGRVDIEAQMTMFAYYYIGIGLGVLFVSYFQVSIYVQLLNYCCLWHWGPSYQFSLFTNHPHYRFSSGCQQLQDKFRE